MEECHNLNVSQSLVWNHIYVKQTSHLTMNWASKHILWQQKN